MAKPLPTKERIIEVAGDIFGRQGFKAATIRKIAKAARVNVAAVNYHFRDKDGLYGAVLEDIFSKGFQNGPPIQGAEKADAPDQRLRIFIHDMFTRFLGHGGQKGMSGRGKLLAREFLDPTPAFEHIVETYIRPQKDLLVSILLELSDHRAGMDRIIPCAISIIGQCVYYAFAAPVIQRLAKDFAPTRENIHGLADHVFRFSMGGIQQINTDPAPGQGKIPKDTVQ